MTRSSGPTGPTTRSFTEAITRRTTRADAFSAPGAPRLPSVTFPRRDGEAAPRAVGAEGPAPHARTAPMALRPAEEPGGARRASATPIARRLRRPAAGTAPPRQAALGTHPRAAVPWVAAGTGARFPARRHPARCPTMVAASAAAGTPLRRRAEAGTRPPPGAAGTDRREGAVDSTAAAVAASTAVAAASTAAASTAAADAWRAPARFVRRLSRR